jgi:CBS domain-containing protein
MLSLLPVTENEKLVGMITDRDIAIRGVAEGKGPDAKVRDAMNCELMSIRIQTTQISHHRSRLVRSS